ncbi:MAG: methylmalonyl Co-A mutase-associated GTPase MeaB [Pseudomonadota bacterium]
MRPNHQALCDGVRAGDRAMLGRAITLIESVQPTHRTAAAAVLQELLPMTGQAHRIGITGVPGVGKSTTIDQLGLNLIEAGHRVAVLAVDPTSSRSGGSILGDKTRMAKLANEEAAFIRPSPTSGTLGGVARKTRETMALCEAAGFDVIIVETVGVGQSETAVADMVDMFLVLLLAGGGDELQGIKKGIIELADLIAINKADGGNVERAARAASEYRAALHILTPPDAWWTPPVMTLSGLNNTGLDDLWRSVEAHREQARAGGYFDARRRRQALRWMDDMLRERVLAHVEADPRVQALMPALRRQVGEGTLTPGHAVDRIAEALGFDAADTATHVGAPTLKTTNEEGTG